MGGLGSGLSKKPGRRRTVDSCWALDARRLSAMGYLRPGGGLGTFPLTLGNMVFPVKLRCETESGADRLYLSYALRNAPESGNGERSGDQETVIEVIPIVQVPSNLGRGSLPYFLCPRESAGCGRRVRKLHLAGRYFLCRSCSNLIYSSPYDRQPWQLAARRASKLRQRLGIIGPNVPGKPPGMWVADYERLLEETLQAETQATEAGTARLQQLIAWIDQRRKLQFTL
jgi:hypothetical protein